MKKILIRIAYRILIHYLNKNLGKNLSDAQNNDHIWKAQLNLQQVLYLLGELK